MAGAWAACMAREECQVGGKIRGGDCLAWLHTFTISSGLTKVTWLMCDAVMIRDIRDRAAALLRVP